MASLKDVADLAGVGVGTVSRVINNYSVKPKTREKVMEAIKVLNYTPNEVARNFKMQKSNLVALLLPSIWNPFFLSWRIISRMSWTVKALNSYFAIAGASLRRSSIILMC
ncbi:LacI family transcriptional regulator [Paenibacillus hexagrammi]|uniref:LacI family transcriptional regulator n=1 Tax=Paenibacillus hexagrammi TaxID=2908839 RepID=A0ABY3SEI5_9BACL|nr:LacI family transcriptional regulator [Paenibacillus sp. YPD9-1]